WTSIAKGNDTPSCARYPWAMASCGSTSLTSAMVPDISKEPESYVAPRPRAMPPTPGEHVLVAWPIAGGRRHLVGAHGSVRMPAMGIPLERCATMRAEMDAGRLRDEVLARAGVSADEWTVAQREWLDKMGAELTLGRFEL